MSSHSFPQLRAHSCSVHRQVFGELLTEVISLGHCWHLIPVVAAGLVEMGMSAASFSSCLQAIVLHLI